MPPRVPFTQTFLSGKELEYVTRVIEQGSLASDGPFSQQSAEWLKQYSGAAGVLMTSSCTAALEMAAMLCELGPGDEVIMPSFTFVSTASAVTRTGAQPVFVDIDRRTLNIDPACIAEQVNSRTRAIIPVHYAGVGCAMEAIGELAREHGLVVIEDAAQGVGAACGGRPLGAHGQLSTFSFHHTKNVACGEGGALCVNDESMLERARILRDKGTNRAAFLSGQVDKYSWVDEGSSYLPSELACAFLLAQLEAVEQINGARKQAYEFYHQQLEQLEEQGHIVRPHVPAECQTNHHLYHLLVADREVRDQLLLALNENGIHAVFHYVPLHLSPMGKRLAPATPTLPVTESSSERILRLPLFAGITTEQQQQVIAAIHDFFT
ncbi:MAG: dTDP-4-amino-4,6-dideoxygalactose transaminase [Pirellulaceae bacterium]